MKVLCPTDFSEHSKLALQFAIDICNTLQAELIVISAYYVPRSSATLVSLRDVVKKNTLEDLDSIMKPMLRYINTEFDPTLIASEGNAVDVITLYCKKNIVDLVVMGTQGQNSVKNILFGSIAKKLTEKSPVPVLVVPSSINDSLDKGKFAIAVDGQSISSSKSFELLIKLAEGYKTYIDILHMHKYDDQHLLPFDPQVKTILQSVIGKVVVQDGDDVIEMLKKYIENHNLGLLVMIKRNHTVLYNLLVRRLTSVEMSIITIPILILPE